MGGIGWGNRWCFSNNTIKGEPVGDAGLGEPAGGTSGALLIIYNKGGTGWGNRTSGALLIIYNKGGTGWGHRFGGTDWGNRWCSSNDIIKGEPVGGNWLGEPVLLF